MGRKLRQRRYASRWLWFLRESVGLQVNLRWGRPAWPDKALAVMGRGRSPPNLDEESETDKDENDSPQSPGGTGDDGSERKTTGARRVGPHRETLSAQLV